MTIEVSSYSQFCQLKSRSGQVTLDSIYDNTGSLLKRAGADPDAVMQCLNAEVRPDVRSSIWQGLYAGRVRTVAELLERFRLGNKS